ncbi:hypothetical protein EMIHUDRAFT_465939 [Emiliania huxleyi CCMP1516]|uniref:Aspartate racemase n=2 Tax=Emiliania huxleyi TaxID=2903 RepID=A0A0D3I4K2_EMIH1|nr:hypothetical protein EMIHUDRAFT_465939 [Emiliania huxleyi CCMP1516]EOD06187.1 hypothetical protein EMIHUDRAFT_465939 [Emiliania huxleyi CCMP1516]|eukprot:XP_005758616.1 hypothetical protein EMIHUDRAFT_465939 [Emiliania huxleyi CCMP1516]
MPPQRAICLCLFLCLHAAHAGPCRFTLRRPLCSLSCLFGAGKCKGSMQKVPSSESGGAPTAWEMVHLKDDGVESSWSTVSFPFVSGGDIGKMTERLPCDGVWLRWTHGSYNYKWHNAPRRQIIASLNGHVEASVGSGDTRRFGPGETLLVEDTRGEGHCTKSLDGVGRWSIFIALPDDGPLAWLFARPTTRELALAALAALAAAALAACALRRPSGAGGLPRRIGLIGGLAPASTIDYYRRINAGVRERLGGRHAAEAVLFSFDQASVIELEFAQRWEEVGEQLARAGLALAAAGCEALLVCCNSVHHEAPPPHTHTLRLRGRRGLEVVLDEPAARAELDRLIYDELTVDVVREEAASWFVARLERLLVRCDAVVLGCTELSMLLDAEARKRYAGVVFDTATLHAEAAVRFALREE